MRQEDQGDREVRFARHELYEQVWDRPASHIARDHGLTPKAIIDACREHDIPRPGSGYWTQRDFGKVVPRVPLPPKLDNGVVILRTAGMNGVAKAKPRTRHVPPPSIDPAQPKSLDEAEPVVEAEAVVQEKDEQDASPPSSPPQNAPIIVQEFLTRPHRLVARAGKCLRGAKGDANGVLMPKERPCLDIRVTKGSLGRALRVMDALIKGLDERGHVVELAEGQRAKTQVTVSGEKLEIWIEEKVSRREKPLTPAEQRKKDANPYYYHFREYFHVPTGVLS